MRTHQKRLITSLITSVTAAGLALSGCGTGNSSADGASQIVIGAEMAPAVRW